MLISTPQVRTLRLRADKQLHGHAAGQWKRWNSNSVIYLKALTLNSDVEQEIRLKPHVPFDGKTSLHNIIALKSFWTI